MIWYVLSFYATIYININIYSCARCHNHKLDPIPTDDYYGLFGILNSSRAVTHTIDAPEPQ